MEGELNSISLVDPQKRKAKIESFKAELESATTAEEKRAVIDRFRAVRSTELEQLRAAESRDQKSSLERLSEIKAQVGNDPEAIARLEKLEARLKSVEVIRAKVAQLENASEEEKIQLQAEIREENRKRMEGLQAEMAERKQLAHQREAATELSPEMTAMRAKSEARKQELDELKEKLGKASAEERRKLLDDWRAQRQAEMTSRMKEVKE